MIILKINNLRKSIDELDEEILNLLSKRINLARGIAKVKDRFDLPIYDRKREEEILNSLSQKASQLGMDKHDVYDIFSAIFQVSRHEQQKQMKKVNCEIKKIGLIGFGRFGKLVVNHLSRDFKFYVYTKSNSISASLKEACQNDIVVLAVPISELENVLRNIKDLLKKNTLVVDICSAKEYPVKLMKKILPKHAQILATHPLFGPDSAPDSLEGKKIVLCRVRMEDKAYSQIKRFLESRQLNIIEATPEEHDRQIAKSLLLTHFIGRALIGMKASALDIDTMSHRKLIWIMDTIKNDTLQLFEDMNKFNRFSRQVRKNFMKSLNEINKELEK